MKYIFLMIASLFVSYPVLGQEKESVDKEPKRFEYYFNSGFGYYFPLSRAFKKVVRREGSVNLSPYMLKSQRFYYFKLAIGNELGTNFST